jgi:hypothetical protein
MQVRKLRHHSVCVCVCVLYIISLPKSRCDARVCVAKTECYSEDMQKEERVSSCARE